MQKLIDRKNTDCFPLWRERGTIRQDGWWKVEPSMLERRNVDRCDWYIKSMEQHFLSYIPNLTSQLHLLDIETLQVLRPLRSAVHEDKLLLAKIGLPFVRN